MTVRHLTQANNIDGDGFVIDPADVHHGAIQGSEIAALGGPVDPTTHLNRDFPAHEIGECTVVERLEVGASVVLDAQGQFTHAPVRDDAFRSFGRVNQGARRAEWLQLMAERRAARDG